MSTQSPIVVAVDGSPESAAALEWAAREAAQTGRLIRVVTAFRSPDVNGDIYGEHWAEQKIAAEQSARERAQWVMSEVLGTGYQVEHVVKAGSIEKLLRTQSDDAFVIVIGTRSAEKWFHKVRGSVTNRVTGSVDCPVVSIPIRIDRPIATAASL